jgi:hypothetical protein
MSLKCTQTFTGDEESFDVSINVFISDILLQNNVLFFL